MVSCSHSAQEMHDKQTNLGLIYANPQVIVGIQSYRPQLIPWWNFWKLGYTRLFHNFTRNSKCLWLKWSTWSNSRPVATQLHLSKHFKKKTQHDFHWNLFGVANFPIYSTPWVPSVVFVTVLAFPCSACLVNQVLSIGTWGDTRCTLCSIDTIGSSGNAPIV